MILELLHIGKFYGESEIIEIAKGKYKLPLTISEGLEQIKRLKKMKNERG
jgi:hypothetical protein